MSDAVWEQAAAHVLKVEGGYVDDPDDAGGATNWGISLRFVKASGVDLDVDGDGDIDADDMKKLTKKQALKVYKAHFWDGKGYPLMKHASVATKCFDMAVNMGPRQANKLIQRAANSCGENLVVDGVIGPASIASINWIDEGSMMNALRKEQANFYIRLVERKPSQKKFLKGWLNRAKLQRKDAATLAQTLTEARNASLSTLIALGVKDVVCACYDLLWPKLELRVS